MLLDPSYFRLTVERFYHLFQNTNLDGLAAVESRGFMFGAPLACQLGVPFIPIRKAGKLPGETIAVNYQLEYDTSQLEVHIDAVKPGQHIVLIDDLIATGGTICAAIELIKKVDANPIACAVVIELTDLNGRSKVSPIPLHSLMTFHEDEF